MSDPYQVLGVPPTATDEEVKAAYRELAKKYHPDNYANSPLADLATEKMKEVNEAYDQIMAERRGNFGGYNPGGQMGGCSACDVCNGLICADCCCECMGGDLISCC